MAKTKAKTEAAMEVVVDAASMREVVDLCCRAQMRRTPSEVCMAIFLARDGKGLTARLMGKALVEARTDAVDFVSEDFRAAVSATDLHRWLGAANPSGTVTIKVDDGILTIVGDGVATKLQLMQVDAPAMDQPEGKRFEIAAATFMDALRAVAQACAVETSRYAVNGILLDGNRLLATDGRRLAFQPVKEVPKGAIVPGELVQIIAGMFDREDTLYMWCDGVRLRIQNDDEAPPVIMCTSLIEAVFPPVDSVVPDQSSAKWSATADAKQLGATIRAAAVNATEETKAVAVMSDSNNRLVIVHKGGATQARHVVGESKVEAGEPETLVNARFLIEAAESGPDEKVGLFGTVSNKPIVFVGTSGYTVVVMPVNVGDQGGWEAYRQIAAGFAG